jgi:hypothetical protein
MAFAFRAGVTINPDMHLYRADLEPGAATRPQLDRFDKLGKSEDLAIESEALFLESFGNSDLDVIHADNAQRHGSSEGAPSRRLPVSPLIASKTFDFSAYRPPHVRRQGHRSTHRKT